MQALKTQSYPPLTHASLPSISPSAARALASRPLREVAKEALRKITSELGAEIGSDLQIHAALQTRRLTGDELKLRAQSLPLLFECAATGEPLLLEIETPIASAMIERLSGGEGCPSLPGPLHEAELAAVSFLALIALHAARTEPLLEELLAVRLAETGGGAEATRRFGQHRECVAVEIALELPRARGQARLILPATVLDRLCSRITGPEPAPSPELLARELGASLRIAAFSIGADELGALGAGDVLLLPAVRRDDGSLAGAAELRFGSFCLRGSLSGFEFTLASVEDATSAEVAMTSTVPAVPPPLPVELKIELGQVRVPISTLAAIEPGSLLRLGTTLSDQVTVLLGDAPFARAELVDVNGELGARVLELIGAGR